MKFPLRGRVVQPEPVTARQRIGKPRHVSDAAHDKRDSAVGLDQYVRAYVVIGPTRVADERVRLPFGSPPDAKLGRNLAQVLPLAVGAREDFKCSSLIG